MIAFGGSFRGHEVFLVDTFGLIKYARQKLTEKGLSFVTIPLLGKYKTKNAEQYHLTPLALRSASGLEFGRWVTRLADAKRMQDLTHGPAFGGSFRGHEVFLVDTFGLIRYARYKLTEKGLSFVMIPFRGKYKTENAELYYLTPLAVHSASGLEFRRWVTRLADAKRMQDLTHGPAFSDAKGDPIDPVGSRCKYLTDFVPFRKRIRPLSSRTLQCMKSMVYPACFAGEPPPKRVTKRYQKLTSIL